jgi:hypothetical protein
MLEYTKARVSDISESQQFYYHENDIFNFLGQSIQEQKKYDLILCLGLVAHVGNLHLLLDLLFQCLEPKTGKLILQTTLLDHFGTRCLRKLTADRYSREKGYSISYFYLHDVISLAKTKGLSASQIERFGLNIPGADRLFPAGNFYLEKWTRSWQQKYGSEALIVLEVDKFSCE